MESESASGGITVAVSIANPSNVPQLMRTALDIAKHRDGRVIVTSVVVEPYTSPFRIFRDEVIKREFSGNRQRIIDEATQAAEGIDVPIDGRLVVGRSVGSGILRLIDAADVDILLMGWNARRRANTVMGHNIDAVVGRTDCDLLIEKIGPQANGVESVCLPVGREPHTELAANVAADIALANDATVEVVRVVGPEASDANRERARRFVENAAKRLPDVTTETRVLEGRSVVETLIATAENHDVCLIGGGRGGWIRRLVVGSTSRAVGRQAETTVIVATRSQGPRTWIEQSLQRVLG